MTTMLGYMDFASYLAAKGVIEGMCPSCVPLAVQLPAAHGSVGVDSDFGGEEGTGRVRRPMPRSHECDRP